MRHRYRWLEPAFEIILGGSLLIAPWAAVVLIPAAFALGVLVLLWISPGGPSLRSHARRRNDLLSRMECLFDPPRLPAEPETAGILKTHIYGQIAGRDAEFLFWLPRDQPPDIPEWAWPMMGGSSMDEDCEPAFCLRVACASAVEFDVKKWGILPGPPFREFKADRAVKGDDPVDFTTKTTEGFSFWTNREECRQLAAGLIQKWGVLQVSVRLSGLTIWWDIYTVMNWPVFGPCVPAVIDTALELARVLDGGECHSGGDRNRRCGRCAMELGRTDAYCTHCGAPWWEERGLSHPLGTHGFARRPPEFRPPV